MALSLTPDCTLSAAEARTQVIFAPTPDLPPALPVQRPAQQVLAHHFVYKNSDAEVSQPGPMEELLEDTMLQIPCSDLTEVHLEDVPTPGGSECDERIGSETMADTNLAGVSAASLATTQADAQAWNPRLRVSKFSHAPLAS